MSLIVCFSGRIGSGKSSLSCSVAERLGWRRVSFGDYVRAEVRRQGGDPSSRQALQDLGEKLVSTNIEEFCRNVLNMSCASCSDNLIVDGVRHISVQDTISSVFQNETVKLIHLTLDDSERYSRIISRDGNSLDLERAENHPVEAELRDTLPSIADLIIDSRKSFDENILEILEFVQSIRA